MLNVYRHLSAYDPKRPFMPWFRTIARNLTVNYWQRNAREKDRFASLMIM
jgi:DNA-directed RNA polymerase specialized sigma24 family protein